MDCIEFKEHMKNFENLTDEQKLAMNGHAANCEHCRDELDFMLSVIETVKSLPQIKVPADFMDKLNTRMDKEDAKIYRRVMLNMRQNGMKYAAAVACFALVAALTVNGTNLVGRMNGGDDTIVTDKVNITDSAASPTPAVNAGGSGQTSEDGTAAGNIAGDTNTSPSPDNADIKSTDNTDKTAAVSLSVSVPSVSSAKVSDAVAPQPSAETRTPVQNVEENELPSSDDTSGAKTVDERDDYSLPRERESLEIAPVVESANVAEGYSLASSDEDVMIAHSRYLHTDNSTGGESQAIGSIKISSDDADMVKNVIKWYSYSSEGNYYVIDSENLSTMLDELKDRGISYGNYVPDYSGDITFQLVID